MAYIHHIETLVPEISYTQEFACEVMKTWTPDPKAQRYINKVYSASGISKRHSVVRDFGQDGSDSLSIYRNNGELREPSTGERNAVFVDESRAMVQEVARRAMENCSTVSTGDITHLITISCTGFYNPGPDLAVMDALSLSPDVERFHLGFMGCYAVFPALKMAEQFCQSNPSATVLIVSVELCSLHLQIKGDLDTVLANSVFADGAAAAVVSGKQPAQSGRAFDIAHFACSLAPEGIEDMAWDIGDKGFNIVLSKYVARIIGAKIERIISGMLARRDMNLQDIDTWAVHPGGRSILDKIETSLKIEAEQIQASRKVLFDYGNMSSPTILFVLAEILQGSSTENGERVCAMAFGPGLTIETAILDAVVS